MTKKKKGTQDVPKSISYQDKLKLLFDDKEKIQTISNTLENVRVVPTMFSSFNRAIGAGGAPVRCTYLIHGPPGGGKSIFTIGILNSFVDQESFGSYVDAEHAATKEWYKDLKVYMDRIMYEQPNDFEGAIDYVDNKMNKFLNAQSEDILSKECCFAFAIDTIHKLAPKDELKQLRSDTKGGGGKNINKRWGMRRAAMIAAWLNKLTPMVGKHNFAFINIAHETEEDDTSNPFTNKKLIRTKGGKELVYEAMARIRILQGKKFYEDGILIGREHVGYIEKNKVGHDGEQFRIYVGNGKGSMPRGFDRGMEIFRELEEQKLLQQSGAWYDICDGEKETRVNGKEKVLNLLRTDDTMYKYYYNLLQENISKRNIENET